MSQVREHLSHDVHEIAENARVMSDWRYYVRNYPLICAAAAVAVGYLIVPSRVRIVRPDPETLAELARRNRLVVKQSTEPERRGGVINALIGLAATAAAKGLTQYVSREAGRYMGGKPQAAPLGEPSATAATPSDLPGGVVGHS